MSSPRTTTTVPVSPSCTTAVPSKYGHVPMEACNSYYNFNPSFAPAVAVCTMFSILTLIHIFLGFFFRKGYSWVLIMGSTWEVVAFVMLSLGSHDQQKEGYSTAYTILFLLAPLWINGFVYMTLARLVYLFSEEHRVWRIQATSLSKIFVWLDIATFIVQGAGGSMTTPGADSSTSKIGVDIYIAGVALQQLFIVTFLCLMIIFHRECLRRDASPFAFELHPVRGPGRWKRLLYVLYAVLLIISIRICYRIAEFAAGTDPDKNPIPFHEVYSYVLDATPMMLCLIILAIWHPGRTFIGPEADLPSRKEKRAIKKAKKEKKAQIKAENKAKKTNRGQPCIQMNTFGQGDESV